VGKPDVTLRLIDIRRWEDSDNVLLRYEVRHKTNAETNQEGIGR
jgi:hypothetical protein